MAPVPLAACGVLQSDDDALKTRSHPLQQPIAADKMEIGGLQGAIKCTVNSNLLVPTGGWQMSAQNRRVELTLAPPSSGARRGPRDRTPLGRGNGAASELAGPEGRWRACAILIRFCARGETSMPAEDAPICDAVRVTHIAITAIGAGRTRA